MVRDAWRFDKPQWLLKQAVASTLLMGALAAYVLALMSSNSCTDSVLLSFGVIYSARLLFATFVLWSRLPDWHETSIVYAVFMPAIFAMMYYGRNIMPYCVTTLYALVVCLYATGSWLSTVGEWQRYVFKANPANKGKLMRTGLWAWSMHVNYLGDSTLFTGWTLAAAGAWWTWWVPIVITTVFIFMHIPGLDECLAERYPAELPAYAAKTRKLVPRLSLCTSACCDWRAGTLR